MNDYEPKNIHRSLNEAVRQVFIAENMEKMAMTKMKDMDKDDVAYAKKLIGGILEKGAEEEMPSPSLTQAPDSAFFGDKQRRSPRTPVGDPDATPSSPVGFGQAVVDGVVNFLDIEESSRRPVVEKIIAGLLDNTAPGQLINNAERIRKLLDRILKRDGDGAGGEG